MKRKRKQAVLVDDRRDLADVPEDDALYRLDCHAEYLRSRSLKFEISLDDVHIGGPLESQPEYIAERADLYRRLAAAISHLSVTERRLIRWRFAGELCQAEIARRMNCSQQKVSKELRRVLLKLRKEMED